MKPVLRGITISVFVMISFEASAHGIEDKRFSPTPYPASERGESLVPDLNPMLPRVVEGVIDQFKLWQAGSIVTACFFESSNAVREQFVEINQEWLQPANLQIDFGRGGAYRDCKNGTPAQIRVAFGATGNWSYVGSDSVRVDMNQPSLNIESGAGRGQRVTDPISFRSTVLHEMGHALALQHEHQGPEANCDSEFDWDTVYATFHSNHGWDRSKVDHNLRSLARSRRLRSTEYDPNSIMHYAFPAWMFKAGEQSRCFTHKAKSVSKLDRAAISLAYPPEPKRQLDLIATRSDFARQVLTDLGLTNEQKAQISERVTQAVKTASPNISIDLTTIGDQTSTSGKNSPILRDIRTGGGSIQLNIGDGK